jgi:hypothetical protein
MLIGASGTGVHGFGAKSYKDQELQGPRVTNVTLRIVLRRKRKMPRRVQ